MECGVRRMVPEPSVGCIPVIPALEEQKQEDHEFQDSLDYTVRLYLKK
jgi:hypothetical protein